MTAVERERLTHSQIGAYSGLDGWRQLPNAAIERICDFFDCEEQEACLAAMRLTCRMWCHHISEIVNTLCPSQAPADLARVFPNVKRIYLPTWLIEDPDSDVTALTALPALRELNVTIDLGSLRNHNNGDSYSLNLIITPGQLQNLRSLNLFIRALHPEDLNSLISLKHLESLSLNIESACHLGHLSALKCLKVLKCGLRRKIDNDEIDSWAHLNHLTRLKIRAAGGLEPTLDPDVGGQFAQYKRLESLSLIERNMTRLASIKAIEAMGQLRELRLHNQQITVDLFDDTTSLHNLTHLDFSYCFVRDKRRAFENSEFFVSRETNAQLHGQNRKLKGLGNLKKLKVLNLSGWNEAPPGSWGSVSALTKLSALIVEETTIRGSDLQAWTSLQQLQKLHVLKCAELDGDCLGIIRQFPQLSELKFCYCFSNVSRTRSRLGPWEHLRQSSNLQHLTLHAKWSTKGDFFDLSGFQNVKFLALMAIPQKFKDVSIRAIAALKELKTLSLDFELNFQDLSIAGLEALNGETLNFGFGQKLQNLSIRPLTKLVGLQSLEIRGALIDPKDVEVVLQMPRLRRLRLVGDHHAALDRFCETPKFEIKNTCLDGTVELTAKNYRRHTFSYNF